MAVSAEKRLRSFRMPLLLSHRSLNKSNGLQKVEWLFENSRVGWNDLIFQEYVSAAGYGVSILFNQGNLRAKFTNKRNWERFSTGGPGTIRTSAINQLLEEYSVEILTKIKYHGVGMVEFKYNGQTGERRSIEANPRFWGSLGLAIQSGVDFLFLLYQMAIDGDVDPVLDFKIGTTTMKSQKFLKNYYFEKFMW